MKLAPRNHPTARQVLTAVVHDARAELGLNNPDYRTIGLMFADALEAVSREQEAGSIEHAGEDQPPDRVPAPPELRTRGRKAAAEKGRKGD